MCHIECWSEQVESRGYLLAVALVLAFLLGFPSVAYAQEDSDPVIVIDYSHGQDQNVQGRFFHDPNFFGNLSEMGYDVIVATGGLNSSLLGPADCLILGSVYGPDNGFSGQEIDAIQEWFFEGPRFIWVAYDSDYSDSPESVHYINTNMSTVLERIGSNVYGEDAHIADNILNCGATYRAIANVTSDDSFVARIVEGVDKVLMHGSTLLYGSNSTMPSRYDSPVCIEVCSILNVHNILHYSPTSYIEDWNPPPPIVYDANQTGSFVAATIQTKVGANQEGVIVVSGGGPYGSYCSMYADEYCGVPLTGSRFVLQVVEFGVSYDPSIPDEVYLIAGGTAVGAVALVVLLLERRKPRS
jgi:hypothetical protein